MSYVCKQKTKLELSQTFCCGTGNRTLALSCGCPARQKGVADNDTRRMPSHSWPLSASDVTCKERKRLRQVPLTKKHTPPRRSQLSDASPPVQLILYSAVLWNKEEMRSESRFSGPHAMGDWECPVPLQKAVTD